MDNSPHKVKTISSGFSLAELLIVMAIFGIFAGLSLVTFSRNLRKERLKALTRESTIWLEGIKKISLNKDIPCEVELNNESQIIKISNQATDDTLRSCLNQGIKEISIAEFTASNGNVEIQMQGTELCGATTTDPLSNIFDNSKNNCSNSNQAFTVFTPRGTLTNSILIYLSLKNDEAGRCIAVLAPTSMIRNGIAKGGSCDFTTAF